MAKFYGAIGYGVSVNKGYGVWDEEVVERKHYGDVLQNNRRLVSGEGVNDDVTVSNEISIVADPFAYEHFHSIRYVVWMGVRWKVTTVNVQRPRLVLTIGSVYNDTTGPQEDSDNSAGSEEGTS